MQRVEAGAVGLQRGGEPVLGDQEVDEEVDPPTRARRAGSAASPAGPAGLGAGLDLVAVDGDDQIRPCREVAVDRAHPDARPGRDVAHRRLDAGGDEDRRGGVEQGLLVAPGVSPPGGHDPPVANRNNVPYRDRSNVPR